MNGNESRVLSLLAVSPSTSWASPMMGAVDEQFIATLIRETDRFKSNGCNYFGRSIQLDGKRGNITTTCGGETISYSGFQFPWGQTVSISVSDVFASLDLGKRDQVACGVLDRSFFISAGPWRLQLPLESGASAIDIEAEKKSLGRVSNHVHLDPKDLAFLLDHLKPFSQEVGSQQFVSLQLNDQVEVAIEAPMEEYDDSPPKRLILSRSTYKGKPTIIPIQSWHLRQSATLGITQLQWHGAAKRLSGTKDRLTYICESSLHLDDDLSLPADAVEIDSAAGSPLPA